ncbi:hypothetical protein [uncultured Nitratireductor sp.]|uniref:hypothetical protein n=1 Tax=uncultured Nitratireductor sp. TaxID=520953 RepID=UPI0025D2589C|nr:hypothetical protein [uncultured Nitratireductor sp.]
MGRTLARKSSVIVVSCILLAPNNSAQAAELSCRQIQDAVRENGSIILRYPSPSGRNIERYDRFVASLDEYSAAFNTLKTRWVPSLDTEACPVHICWNND